MIFGTQLYSQTWDIPMWTNCDGLLLICFCFVGRDTSGCVSTESQASYIEAFHSSFRYLDDCLHFDKCYYKTLN